MKRQKFVYNAHTGDNTKFIYIPKIEQKANFVYKESHEILKPILEEKKWKLKR